MEAIEARSNSALFKRADQLKRWQESDTCREPSEPKHKSRRIQFTDGCVFLAACAASDKDEVDRLLRRGADIDTANVDGLTALHQACIDDNLEMVEFLVQRGADVNRGDNEGWTPLHATASCGFLSIAKYLLDNGASVSAVNNDGELAIDISESDEMEELLQKEIDAQGIDCEESRHTEERMMLEDARQWLNAKALGDVPHQKTGATALHVAAAKGYVKVMALLLQTGTPINSLDFDGWTPLHAAAHWAQREACEVLCENLANMDIKNHVGQTAFDVADPDVTELLTQLKKKQANLQKDRPDIRSILNRPPVPSTPTTPTAPAVIPSPATVPAVSSLSSSAANAKRSTSVTVSVTLQGGTKSVAAVADQKQHLKNGDDNDESDLESRSSITRISVDNKHQRSKQESSQERDLLLSKTPLTDIIQEKSSGGDSNETSSYSALRHTSTHLDKSPSSSPIGRDEIKVPTYTPPQIEEKDSKGLSGSVGDSLSNEVHPWRRPASLRIRPTGNTESLVGAPHRLSPSTESLDINLRRNHSFEDRKRQMDIDSTSNNIFLKKDALLKNQTPPVRSSDAPPSSSSTSEGGPPQVSNNEPELGDKAGIKTVFKQFFKSFVPPVRDEESETQRKAHAKRVRETRRSTQGVTLEDLKSAEQLVKKKQQMENQQRTSELQQLVASQQQQKPESPQYGVGSLNSRLGSSSSALASSGNATTTHRDNFLSGSNEDSSEKNERPPSWKLRLESSKSKFLSDDSASKPASGSSNSNSSSSSANAGGGSISSTYSRSTVNTSDPLTLGIFKRTQRSEERVPPNPTVSVTNVDVKDGKEGESSTGHHVITRKKKPKRRSTGVVQLEDIDPNGESEEDEDSQSSSSKLEPVGKTRNGDADYRKLYEESVVANTRLKEELAKVREELVASRKKWEAALQAATSSGLSETEKKEKKALEKKLSEMEEELKQLEHLKNDNQRLRDENGALIRVISKLSK